MDNQTNPPQKLFAKARINNKWKYVTFDCVGLSVKDEPAFRGFHKLIEDMKTVVQFFRGRRCRIIEINAIH